MKACHAIIWTSLLACLDPNTLRAGLDLTASPTPPGHPTVPVHHATDDKGGNTGQSVKFSFRVNNGGGAFELAAGRSVSKQNPLTFHNDWATHWANEIEFGFE